MDYELPGELIAQAPAESRCGSRLLVLGRADGGVQDRSFADIAEYIDAGDCLVVNDTKVLPARFFARRLTGARLEGLFLAEHTDGRWEVMLKNSRKVRCGEEIILFGRDRSKWGHAVALQRLDEGRWLLEMPRQLDVETILAQTGFAPLPPYIKRGENSEQAADDLQRYQTVYARQPGAVAAPTAGLHFTSELLAQLRDKGVRSAYATLHVGAGTFKPVTAENLADHKIHSERFSLTEADADVINDTISTGGRIVAVGTTSVRTLETLAAGGRVKAGRGQTDLFIQPGYEFQVVDAMVTNFHLPRSTLLALVGAFAGLENVLAAYRHAIDQRYRFYSYGDAMLII
ncbi:MAG: tRNA preQ1(34) S-adenosylmethionine ribosyltransferase-isomerase QueA [Planctomycetes bacterium]|nr:tRNA preQ1(34) S-adenosylmethionine ribosyltransferase-isomerase QueA [Planctomycetota bacterium]